MTQSLDLNTPWTLRFERDGTEDVAYILDANEEPLVESREFWLPERDDPVPTTLRAVRVMYAAPALLEACRLVVSRWERGDLAEAVRACDLAIAAAVPARPDDAEEE